MEDRKEELKKALGLDGRVQKPTQRQTSGRQSLWRVRRNWGFWVLMVGFVLYLIWVYAVEKVIGG